MFSRIDKVTIDKAAVAKILKNAGPEASKVDVLKVSNDKEVCILLIDVMM